MTRRRTRWLAATLACALTASSAVAWGFWSGPVVGTASAITGTLDAAALDAPGSALNLVTVTWTEQASLNPASEDNTYIAYAVERRLDGGPWAEVSSGGCAGSWAYPASSCDDAPGSAGSYDYRVVASYGSWTATSSAAGPVAVTIDAVPPTALSIDRLDATPTSAGTVHWRMTFSEAVTGVGAGDLALARGGGLTGGAIGSVTGSGTTYTVTASTGSGSGTLGLNLVDDDSIVDAGANPLGGSGAGNGNRSGQTYALDRTAPVATSIARADPTPTNAGTAHWTVTFGESVSGVGAGDFALATTGVSGPAIGSVTGSGATYTVTASTGGGDGTVGLNLVDDDSIVDAAANPLGGSGAGNGNLTGQVYAIDKTAPALSSLSMLDTDADGRIDRVSATFSETLASSTITGPWTLAGVPSAGSLAGVSTSGAGATLTIAEGAGAADTAAGTFTVALATNASGIRDAAGNQASFTAAAPADKAGPVPIAVGDGEGQNPLDQVDGELQGGDTFHAVFSEPIAGGLPGSTPITESESSGANATLTIAGFTDGALDMGSTDYVGPDASVAFAAISALSNANTTITITAGSCSASCLDVRAGTGTKMTYRPAPTLLDAAGNAATGSAATGFRIF
ncbi:MAG: hypothetical protein QOJ35_2589 [Solirubrobacteraceae bacterium]|jgi:hypothetical protein|nr:hypothetical protein [Solirubrobacteraceae bacterium]